MCTVCWLVLAVVTGFPPTVIIVIHSPFPILPPPASLLRSPRGRRSRPREPRHTSTHRSLNHSRRKDSSKDLRLADRHAYAYEQEARRTSTSRSLTAASLGGLAPHNATVPALYLYPLNYLSPSSSASPSSSGGPSAAGGPNGVANGGSGSDTWAPKHIALTNVHTKIGRQTSSKTAPGERNGYFDSKVLSRQHAEVWEEGGKIFIKDVKSSNGTFINGERLSSEGHESEPFELKSDDIVEFGIDIVGEDNKTIIHHKVAARVVCVFTEQDAAVAARAEQHAMALHLQQQQQLGHGHPHQQQHQQHQNLLGHGGPMGGYGGQGGGMAGMQREGSMNMSMHQQHLAHLAQQAAQGQSPSGQHPNGVHSQQGQQPQQIQPGLNGVNGLHGAGGINGMVAGGPQAQAAAAAAARRNAAMGGLGGLGGLGGMGGPSGSSTSPNSSLSSGAPSGAVNGAPTSNAVGARPGKGGLSFDVILSRLQGEVQKSRETGLELAGVGGTLGEVGGVLTGGGSELLFVRRDGPFFFAFSCVARLRCEEMAPFFVELTKMTRRRGASRGYRLCFCVSCSALDARRSRDEICGMAEKFTTHARRSMPRGQNFSANHLPNYPAHLPPVRPPPAGEVPAVPASKDKPLVPTAPSSTDDLSKLSVTDASAASEAASTAAEKTSTEASIDAPQVLISTLQSQLTETQSALAAHLDKVRALEGVLAEQAALRREVGMLRVLVEGGAGSSAKDAKRTPAEQVQDALQEVSLEERSHEHEHDEGDETEVEGEGGFRPRYRRHDDDEREDDEGDEDDREEEDDDDDDVRSIATTMPSSHGHELESVAEEDEDAVDQEEHEAVRVEQHEREGSEEELAALARVVGEGLEVEVLEALDEGQRERPLVDDEDEYMSDQERREIELRRKEDEAAAAATTHDHSEDSLLPHDVITEDLVDDHEEDAERRRERADGVGAGRPHTPEPTRAVSSSAGGPGIRRRSLASPLSQVSNHALMRGDVESTSATSPQKDDATAINQNVQEQLQRLSTQLGTVLALTTSLEAQHAAAQGTIVALEGKVASLEGLLKDAEHALRSSSPAPALPYPASSTDEHQPTTLTALLAAWKTSVEGQWGIVQEEWSAERKRLAEAREEWEARRDEWDTRKEAWDAKERQQPPSGGADVDGPKGVAGASGSSNVQNLLAEHQAAIRDLQQQYRAQQTQLNSTSSSHRHSYSHGNGDALKHTGGLVTPPSPRSQSSDSNRRYGRRRRRSSGSRASRASRSPSPERHHRRDSHTQEEEDRPRHFVDEPHPLGADEGVIASAIGAGAQKIIQAAERTLASPEPSVYSSVGSLDGKTLTSVINPGSNSSPTKRKVDLLERDGTDELDPASLFGSQAGTGDDGSSQAGKSGKQPFIPVNVQAAMGVMLLSVAAAAVMWKVTPE
ncbi:hypothetical protein D9619_011079 [Psilocybe cf. subviscida]|uniref:FHA domain-containing protein n=1 Tax=Psilocybe cf. subviscida TaxID=2480587 RepID=A0A8H5BL39_9AGAR|nr:hypothetical protein D9619_011079 [Psilocybe cf. subviscida]